MSFKYFRNSLTIFSFLVGIQVSAGDKTGISFNFVKHASEQAMDNYVESGQGSHLADYQIDLENEQIVIKHFSYENSVSNIATLATSYFVKIDTENGTSSYECNSQMSVDVVGSDIFTLINSTTTCVHAYDGDDIYKP